MCIPLQNQRKYNAEYRLQHLFPPLHLCPRNLKVIKSPPTLASVSVTLCIQLLAHSTNLTAPQSMRAAD